MSNNDYSLQISVSQGNEAAFKSLFNLYHDRLFGFILNIVKSRETAEELVMDVFLKLWLARDMIAEIENMDGFLFKIAYHKCIDFFRSASREEYLSSDVTFLDYRAIGRYQ